MTSSFHFLPIEFFRWRSWLDFSGDCSCCCMATRQSVDKTVLDLCKWKDILFWDMLSNDCYNHAIKPSKLIEKAIEQILWSCS